MLKIFKYILRNIVFPLLFVSFISFVINFITITFAYNSLLNISTHKIYQDRHTHISFGLGYFTYLLVLFTLVGSFNVIVAICSKMKINIKCKKTCDNELQNLYVISDSVRNLLIPLRI